jgi:gamma-D-glutamyl-L-lysine dipeptidyl-peptidase
VNVPGCCAAVITAVVTSCTPSALPHMVLPAATTISVGQSVWTNVSVATLWVLPSSPRAVDAPALANPVRIRAWLAAMSTAVRRDLAGRVETQTLYGERLVVTGVRSGWLHVAAVGQPTHRDARGYPGWVPRRQVTVVHPTARTYVATVVNRLAGLRRPDGSLAMKVSFGTRLPVLATGEKRTTVATPTGLRATISNTAVVRRLARDPALPLRAAAVMRSAEKFVGTPYLWGGRSGFAVDCSGYTNLVYGVHGLRLPRDADDQARRGSAVALGAQHTADLMFFQHSTTIDHVGFYAGSGVLLHAPHTGAFVGRIALGDMSGLVRARRFV